MTYKSKQELELGGGLAISMKITVRWSSIQVKLVTI